MTMGRRVKIVCAVVVAFVATGSIVHAQGKKEVRWKISYIAGVTVYVDAGREQHLAVGDTLHIVRSQKEIGIVVITAVSGVSSAASIVVQHGSFVVGDGAVAQPGIGEVSRADARTDSPENTKRPVPQNLATSQLPPSPAENVLSGRVSLQYNAIFAEESKFNMNQPAASFRFNVANLMGTGMRLSLNARSYYDLSNNYTMYGGRNGLNSRAYEISLVQDSPDASLGYGLGRLTSRYVGGMGTFDGAQLYYHFDDFTAGILGGAQVVDRTLTFSQDGTKGSFFLNYHNGPDIFHQYDGTIAYGRQMVGSNLDRQFIYLQNSLSLGSRLMMYESSEIELNDIANGVRTSAFKFSNSFLNVNYQPADWLSANLGYDALRTVYLFETMKAIPDSLIDRNLNQGFRASATVYLPMSMTVSADARYGSRQGGYRDSHSFGGSIRTYDMVGSDIDGGVRYTNFVGAFSDGDNVSLDLDRSFGQNLTAELRFEYNKYHIPLFQQLYITRTALADIFYQLSSTWFMSINGEYLYDPTMTSFQFYGELGFRF
jgi:hypothetical protein